MIRIDRIRLERMLRDYSAHPVRAVFKIDVKTCTITEIIRLNRPKVHFSSYKHASPEKLIRNRNAAELCRTIIRSVHTTGSPQIMRFPITIPAPYPETVCTRVHFKKGPVKNTVLAISMDEHEFL